MRLGLPLLASALLAGCIPVVMRTTVDAGSRGNLPESQPLAIQAGTSRRADVLLELGEPDGRAPDESWYVYSLTRTSGVGGFLIVGGGGAVGAVGGIVGSQDMTRILVRFDSSGGVTSVEPARLHCGHYAGAFPAWVESAPCASPTGEDLQTAARDAEKAARTAAVENGDYGAVIESYPWAFWVTSLCEDAKPHWAGSLRNVELRLTERALLERDKHGHAEWNVFQLRDLDEPTVRNAVMTLDFVRVKYVDGRCLYFGVRHGLLGHVGKAEQEALRDRIIALKATLPKPDAPGSAPRVGDTPK